MIDINSISITKDASLLDALKKMDQAKHKSLLVFSGIQFYSIITIGEIQRAIIKNVNLSSPIETVINVAAKKYASVSDSIESIKDSILRMQAEIMPVLDDDGNIVKLYQWSDFFPDEIGNDRSKIDLPVVIMAGGMGTRLKPITNIIPKPLIPVGRKTILEIIMNQFEKIGCQKFYMSVNYKFDLIQYYLSQLDRKYDIEFFKENEPLGTIGSVALLKGKITSPFFVSNCDSITDQDYRDVYDYHILNHNDMTIVTMIKDFKIPYGVIETGKDGLIVNILEKPEKVYHINTGVYILNPECIEEIPNGEIFHIPDLIDKIKNKGGRVGCFPISENSWHDIGEWPVYLKMINAL